MFILSVDFFYFCF